jgi:hypothetical protein
LGVSPYVDAIRPTTDLKVVAKAGHGAFRSWCRDVGRISATPALASELDTEISISGAVELTLLYRHVIGAYRVVW